MPTLYDDVYVAGAGLHLPGEPVDNDGMDAYIAPLSRVSGRIKQRILAENGIRSRHYAIGPDGQTRISHAQMAGAAVQAALADARRTLSDVDLLACGTSGGDAILPGFANLVQGELGAPPMQTHTSLGVCASSLGALAFAAGQVQHGDARHALVVGSDLPSRMFKASRFAPRGYDADFNAHFLRWMLSDGAGALLLSRRAALDDRTPCADPGLRLRLRWLHQRSFSGDHPVCMQLGLDAAGQRSYLDYDSAAAAEQDGALALRQDIRLLPRLFDVAIHEYAQLVEAGLLDPARVDHFLCHYSSERFRPIVDDLMQRARLAIDRERWWSNLAWRGNTGAASLFVMLAEFLRTRPLAAGQRIFCFVPESGRFTVAYALFEVEAAEDARRPVAGVAHPATGPAPASPLHAQPDAQQPDATRSAAPPIAAPHEPDPSGDPRLARLLQALAGVWHDYRSRAWRTPLVQAINRQQFGVADYRHWMACWIPQVREGSRWMRAAVRQLTPPFDALAALIEAHAGDEQFDFRILFDDYRHAGGDVAAIDDLRRNPGGDALNAYLHALAATPDPVGLLGAIYIIEGTGQRIIPALLPALRRQLDLPPAAFRFLAYHGTNDAQHLSRWLDAVTLTQRLGTDTSIDVDAAILTTARRTAELYLMQWEDAFPPKNAR